jgi:hypothetical protein
MGSPFRILFFYPVKLSAFALQSPAAFRRRWACTPLVLNISELVHRVMYTAGFQSRLTCKVFFMIIAQVRA